MLQEDNRTPEERERAIQILENMASSTPQAFRSMWKEVDAGFRKQVCAVGDIIPSKFEPVVVMEKLSFSGNCMTVGLFEYFRGFHRREHAVGSLYRRR